MKQNILNKNKMVIACISLLLVIAISFGLIANGSTPTQQVQATQGVHEGSYIAGQTINLTYSADYVEVVMRYTWYRYPDDNIAHYLARGEFNSFIDLIFALLGLFDSYGNIGGAYIFHNGGYFEIFRVTYAVLCERECEYSPTGMNLNTLYFHFNVYRAYYLYPLLSYECKYLDVENVSFWAITQQSFFFYFFIGSLSMRKICNEYFAEPTPLPPTNYVRVTFIVNGKQWYYMYVLQGTILN